MERLRLLHRQLASMLDILPLRKSAGYRGARQHPQANTARSVNAARAGSIVPNP
jgi:hypothetical protein